MPSFFKDFQGQDWFYHSSNKKTNASKIETPLLSQVPGLTEVNGTTVNNDQMNKSKKGWLRDTDSEFIQMAKQGGRRDLLVYNENLIASNEPIAYPRVDWFDHTESEFKPSQPPQQKQLEQERDIFKEYKEYNESMAPAGVITNQGLNKKIMTENPPFSLDDDLSYWQRLKVDQPVKTEKSRKIERFKLPSIKNIKDATENIDSLNNNQKAKGKNVEEHVNFGYLMSMGYQRDWFDEKGRRDRDEDEKKKKQQTLLKEKVKLAMKPRFPKIQSQGRNNRENFKLSKFKNVDSKIKSQWKNH